MIFLERDRRDKAVHANFKGAKRVKNNLLLLQKKQKGELVTENKNKWNSAIWKEAKDQLLRETYNKCAYCESDITQVGYGDVEHFRPKSKYWWLAYSYENYLASCAICNQQYKGDEFEIGNPDNQMQEPGVAPDQTDDELLDMAPYITVDPVKDEDGLPLEEFTAQINAEYALLIHPYFDDPEEYLTYKPDLTTKAVEVVARKPTYESIKDACERMFGINRLELRDRRFAIYCFYMTYRYTLTDPGISAATRQMTENRLQEMRSAFGEYAGMVRYFDKQPLEQLPWGPDVIILESDRLRPQPPAKKAAARKSAA